MKLPEFPIEIMLRRIEAAIAQYPKAAMFSLREQGYNSLFEQLVSCIISIRTLDETTIPVSLRIFEKARTPEAMLALGREPLADLLFGSTFPGQKADTIRAVSEAAIANGGAVPQTFEALTALKGVGPKCANLALGWRSAFRRFRWMCMCIAWSIGGGWCRHPRRKKPYWHWSKSFPKTFGST